MEHKSDHVSPLQDNVLSGAGCFILFYFFAAVKEKMRAVCPPPPSIDAQEGSEQGLSHPGPVLPQAEGGEAGILTVLSWGCVP